MCIRMILTRLNCFSTRLIENGFYSIIFSNFRFFFFLEFLLIYKKSQRLLCDRNKELITVIIGLMQSISIFSFTMCHNLRRRIYYYWHLRISPRQLPGIFNFQLSSPLAVLQSPARRCDIIADAMRTRDLEPGIMSLGWSGGTC